MSFFFFFRERFFDFEGLFFPLLSSASPFLRPFPPFCCQNSLPKSKKKTKKNTGEYIAPEKIEGIYSRSPLVAQAFVYGDSLRPQLVAVVVPDAEELGPWAKAHGLGGDLASLCAHPAVRDAVLKSMLDEGRSARLRGFEQVAAVALSHELFSVENGLLTPTFKLKRPQAKAAFQAQIDAMYSGLKP